MATGTTRPVSWIKAARKDFEAFPPVVQLGGLRALTVAAEGGKADNVKPLQGFTGGVLEIVLRHRGDAFRVVYAVQIGADIGSSTRFRRNRPKGLKRRSTRSILCMTG